MTWGESDGDRMQAVGYSEQPMWKPCAASATLDLSSTSDFVRAHPHLELNEYGKVHCSITNHDIVCDMTEVRTRRGASVRARVYWRR